MFDHESSVHQSSIRSNYDPRIRRPFQFEFVEKETANWEIRNKLSKNKTIWNFKFLHDWWIRKYYHTKGTSTYPHEVDTNSTQIILIIDMLNWKKEKIIIKSYLLHSEIRIRKKKWSLSWRSNYHQKSQSRENSKFSLSRFIMGIIP